MPFILGCDSPPRGPTGGYIRFQDGSPVTSGSVEFRNLKTRERYSSKIQTDGSIAPTSQNGELGLLPGSYEIVVVQIVLTEDLAAEAHTHGKTVPRKYADYYTSDLKLDISESDSDPMMLIIPGQ